MHVYWYTHVSEHKYTIQYTQKEVHLIRNRLAKDLQHKHHGKQKDIIIHSEMYVGQSY